MEKVLENLSMEKMCIVRIDKENCSHDFGVRELFLYFEVIELEDSGLEIQTLFYLPSLYFLTKFCL